MQTNPFRAEEATLYFTYCTCLLVYDYLLYITYVTLHLMSFTNVVIVYDSPYYEIQHKYDKVNDVLLYYEIMLYVSI